MFCQMPTSSEIAAATNTGRPLTVCCACTDRGEPGANSEFGGGKFAARKTVQRGGVMINVTRTRDHTTRARPCPGFNRVQQISLVSAEGFKTYNMYNCETKWKWNMGSMYMDLMKQ